MGYEFLNKFHKGAEGSKTNLKIDKDMDKLGTESAEFQRGYLRTIGSYRGSYVESILSLDRYIYSDQYPFCTRLLVFFNHLGI